MMQRFRFLAVGPLAVGLLSGCVASPEAYETPPVDLETPKGVVTCQLYTDEIVLWDRAIRWPRAMSAEAADALCKKEGNRRAGKTTED